MGLMEDVTLTDSIEIKTTPEKVFDFLVHLVDDESYRSWHPEDHVTLRWLKGNPWEEGSLVYAEEYIHGKLHKLKFLVTKVVPNREIEYVPVSWFLRRYCPKNTFYIEPREKTCVFTATGTYRVGWLVRTFASNRLNRGFECFYLLRIDERLRVSSYGLRMSRIRVSSFGLRVSRSKFVCFLFNFYLMIFSKTIRYSWLFFNLEPTTCNL